MKALRTLGILAALVAMSVLPASAAATGHFERTLQVSGPVDLDVVSGSGNITVHTGSSTTVSVSAKIHANASWLFGGDPEERVRRIEKNPPVEQQGNTIRIGHVEDRELLRNISIDYDLTVPAQTKVSTRTGSGDVKVDTGSGNVKLRGVKGGIRASTGSGDIQAEGEATHDWRLGAGSGNITLRLPSQAAFDLNARTSSGSLKVNRQITTQGTFSRREIQGKVGGGGVLLELHTGSGDIEIN
jgi:Putative adhesin